VIPCIYELLYFKKSKKQRAKNTVPVDKDLAL
jgi:hypothetical protein